MQVSTCSTCSGEGKIITELCLTCRGSGKVESKRSISIDIPAGVNDGATMQLRKEGNFDSKRYDALNDSLHLSMCLD